MKPTIPFTRPPIASIRARREQEDSLTRVIQNADTDAINVPVGGRVRCIMAELKGAEGVMVATRTLGRVLIRIADGVFGHHPQDRGQTTLVVAAFGWPAAWVARAAIVSN